MNWLFLLLSLLVLLGGGEFFIRGAVAIARRLRVSPVVMGLTIVAFGTSAPELAVNVIAAWKGETGITFGNIVGSNIANVGLILGLSATLGAMTIDRSFLKWNLPLMLVATGLTVMLCMDRVWGQSSDVVTRQDGIILLALFVGFVWVTVRPALRAKDEREADDEDHPSKHWVHSIVTMTIGLVGVLVGSHHTVNSAVTLASALGVSQAVIGITLIAVGTSLPELATSLIAIAKGHADLAVGNVVGSNAFNLLLILGVSSTVHDVSIPDGGMIDLAVMAVFSLALFLFAITHQRKIVRWEGAVLLATYATYIAWRVGLTG